MFMVSFRLKKRRILIAAALVLMLGFAVMGGVTFFGDQTVTADASVTEQPERPSRVRTNDQRLEYIASFGWIVEPEPVEIMEVIIPTVFDELYEEYNALQTPLGYDLAQHMGRRTKRYTYVVTNYPGIDQDVRLNLLVRDNRVIGGDIYSLGDNAFMHGLALPNPQPEQVPEQVPASH